MALRLVSFGCYGLALSSMLAWAFVDARQIDHLTLVLPVLKTAPMVLLSVNAFTRLSLRFDATVALLGLAFLFHGAGDFLLAETCSICFTAGMASFLVGHLLNITAFLSRAEGGCARILG